MGVDLTKLSDADLQAVKAGDLSKVSDAGLQVLKGAQPADNGGARTARNFLGIPYNPEREAALRQQLATGGWGTGVPKLADAVAGHLADAGSPGIATAAHLAPEALQMVIGGNVTGAAKPVVEAGAKWLMQGAIKPSVGDLLSGDAARGVQTLLDEGINVTKGGMAEIRRRVTALHDQVEQTIADSTNRVGGENIPQMVNRAYNKFRYSTINPEATIGEIKKAVEDYMSTVSRVSPSSAETGSIPVQIAQKMKRANQQQLADEYGTLTAPYAEAQKDITRGLRQGIETAHPEVAPQNARMEELLNALSVSEGHALQALNKNPAGLTLLAENPKAAAAFALDRSAAFKSVLANMIYKARAGLSAGTGAVATGIYDTASTPSQ